jgi:hypothetical protein
MKQKKYRYIIGVTLNHPKNIAEEVTYSIKYFLEITEKEWEQYSFAIFMSKDKLWKTNLETSLKITKSERLHSILNMMSISARCNDVTLHSFNTTFKATEEDFDYLLKTKGGRKLINSARIL